MALKIWPFLANLSKNFQGVEPSHFSSFHGILPQNLKKQAFFVLKADFFFQNFQGFLGILAKNWPIFLRKWATENGNGAWIEVFEQKAVLTQNRPHFPYKNKPNLWNRCHIVRIPRESLKEKLENRWTGLLFHQMGLNLRNFWRNLKKLSKLGFRKNQRPKAVER